MRSGVGLYAVCREANFLRIIFLLFLSVRFVQTPLYGHASSRPLSLFFRIPALAPGLSHTSLSLLTLHFLWHAILSYVPHFSLSRGLLVFSALAPKSVQEISEPSGGMEDSLLGGMDGRKLVVFVFWYFSPYQSKNLRF